MLIFFSFSKPNFLVVTLLKALFLSSRATVLYHSIWFRCFQIFLLPLLQPQKRVLCTELRVKKKRSHATFSHLGIILSDGAFYFQVYLINIFTASQSWTSNTAKPCIPQKSCFQWTCSKFFVLWLGHNSFVSAHFGILTQRLVHPTAPVLLTKIYIFRLGRYISFTRWCLPTKSLNWKKGWNP